MTGGTKKWLAVLLVAIAAAITVAVVAALAGMPYLPAVHGTTAGEVDQLVDRLELKPGSRVADLGAGNGRYSLALATRVGTTGKVYATELDQKKLEQIRRAVRSRKLPNVEVIAGGISATNLPAACCDALFSRNVYHHLTDPGAINADIHRALRPGGRLLVIDFEPGGILDWIGVPGTTKRHGGHGTPKETVVREVTAAGFELMGEPRRWRGKTYAVLFRRP
jgi:ubiquinone/menaquinone biosynthesis C-methylase UbiE